MVENVPPTRAWEALASDKEAQLVDVRTDMEWQGVGLPDLSGVGKQPVLISWQVPPSMRVNANFAHELREAGLRPEQPLYFICRSGARSMAAAEAARAAGFSTVFNVADGFEGSADMRGRRGGQAGWQADGLPWSKD